MSRPPTGGQPRTTVLSTKVEAGIKAALKQRADQLGITLAEAVRTAVTAYLESSPALTAPDETPDRTRHQDSGQDRPQRHLHRFTELVQGSTTFAKGIEYGYFACACGQTTRREVHQG